MDNNDLLQIDEAEVETSDNTLDLTITESLFGGSCHIEVVAYEIFPG
ncbi:11659_t:CDS:2, partial [Scutellospora calospora]